MIEKCLFGWISCSWLEKIIATTLVLEICENDRNSLRYSPFTPWWSWLFIFLSTASNRNLKFQVSSSLHWNHFCSGYDQNESKVFRAFDCNPSSKKNLASKNLQSRHFESKCGEFGFLRISGERMMMITYDATMTPLLEFPFPFLHPGSFWWWDPPPFPGNFWLFQDPKKSIQGEYLVVSGSQTRWNSGELGVPTKMWLEPELLFFDSKSWAEVLQVPTWIFFFLKRRELERWWIERRSGTDRPSQGSLFFNIPSMKGPIWLTHFHFLGEIRLGCYSNSWHNPWHDESTKHLLGSCWPESMIENRDSFTLNPVI